MLAIGIDPLGLDRMTKLLTQVSLLPGALIGVEVGAVNLTLTSTRAYLVRLIRQYYPNFPVSYLRALISVNRRATKADPVGSIMVLPGSKIGLDKMDARPRQNAKYKSRQKITFLGRKDAGRQVLERGFWIPSGNGIFQRVGKSRYPIKKGVFHTRPADMFQDGMPIWSAAEVYARDSLAKFLEQRADAVLLRSAGVI